MKGLIVLYKTRMISWITLLVTSSHVALRLSTITKLKRQLSSSQQNHGNNSQDSSGLPQD